MWSCNVGNYLIKGQSERHITKSIIVGLLGQGRGEGIFRKQKRTAVYRHVSLVLDFKLTQEIMICYLRETKLLRYRNLCILTEYTKMQILNKKCQTNMVHTFWGTWTDWVLKYLDLDHFGRYRTKTCGVKVKLRSKKY